MAFESQCNLMEITSDSKMWSGKMPQGLDLEIFHHPLTMRRVVNLVVAMERLKASKSEFTCSTEFRDDMTEDSEESANEEDIENGDFRKSKEKEYRVTDQRKRDFELVKETMELHAVLLKGGQADRIAYLIITNYIPPRTNDRPVTLAINGTNLYLSCTMDDGKPTLHLEELEDKEQLRRINQNSDMVRFLFFRQDTVGSTLMSAQFPDWYISTADQDNMPVDMCQQSSGRYQTFTIVDQSWGRPSLTRRKKGPLQQV